jgi:hypothetical protein
MSEKNELTAAERLRQIATTRPLEIVELTAPSGFVYKFKKMNKFSLLFGAGELPQTATNGASGTWEQNGLIKFEDLDTDTQIKVGKKVFEVRDKVLFLSYDPKIVAGMPSDPNEISADDVPEEDLEYLFKWVAAGGDESAMLTLFPERRGQNALAGSNGKKQRKTGK